MGNKNVNYILNKINSIILKLGPLDIFDDATSARGRRACQRTITEVYDELFEVKRYLELLQKHYDKQK